MKREKVIIGLLGSNLDKARSENQWETWRPTVSICQHPDLLVNRFELIVNQTDLKLAKSVLADIQSVSPETQTAQHVVDLKDPWDFEEVYAALHDFSRSYEFDVDKYEYWIHITTGTHVVQICLFLLTESRHLPGAILQTSPPRGGRRGKRGGKIGKNKTDAVGTYRLIDLDLSRYDAIASRFEQDQIENLSYLKSGIETRNQKFNQLIEQIEKVAIATRAPILITGPTGAGKSKLARRIYELKRNREQISGPFVEVNCATLRGDQAMSSLFGHVMGSFTGATKDRKGYLKSADQGILFLDEIGELGMDEQSMLLRAIEEKRFQPVGADDETSSDFQLLAGTNRDLGEAINQGTFREDLLARINLWTFSLPGLVQRKEDIEPNLDFELDLITRNEGRKITINREAREKFLSFALSNEAKWTANFRDLNATVTRMATLSTTGRINVAIVDQELERLRLRWKSSSVHSDDGVLTELLGEQANQLDRFDKSQLAEVIQVCRESKTLSAAGRTLFDQSRKSKKQPNDADRLRKYLAKHGLSWKKICEE